MILPIKAQCYSGRAGREGERVEGRRDRRKDRRGKREYLVSKEKAWGCERYLCVQITRKPKDKDRDY